MAEGGLSVDQFSCPVCLELLKDPVAIQCGHSFCKVCINGCWDQEDLKGVYSCPQCRRPFAQRPVVGKNTMLAEVVEKLKMMELHPASPAGPGDVECDVCTGRKLKALKSCLVCLASYCETHLQPHYQSPAFKRHKLVKASRCLQEQICSEHERLLEVYCRTDQQCICMLCTMDDHRGHDTVSAAAERAEKQRQMVESQKKYQQKTQEREKELQELKKTVKSHKSSAQAALEDTERIFTELICCIERKRSEISELIRAQEEAAVRGTEGVLERLEQEIAELRRRNTELDQLLLTVDHLHFLQSFQSLSAPPGSIVFPTLTAHPVLSFEEVVMSVSQLRDKVEELCKEEIRKTPNRDLPFIGQHVPSPVISVPTLSMPLHPQELPSPEPILSKPNSSTQDSSRICITYMSDPLDSQGPQQSVLMYLHPQELPSPEPILPKPTDSRSASICLPNMSDPLECQEPLEAVPMPTISMPLPPLELSTSESILFKPFDSRPASYSICSPYMSDSLESQEPLEAVPMPTISMTLPPLELPSPEPILSKTTGSRPESPRICLPNMSDLLESQEHLEAVPMPTISMPLPPLELPSPEPILSKPTTSRPESPRIFLPNMSDPLECQEPLETVPMLTISMPLPPLELTSPEPILSKPTNSRPESPRIFLPNMSDPLEREEPLEAVPMPTISMPLPPLELTSLEPILSKPTTSRPESPRIFLPNMSDPLECQEPLEAVPMPTISMPLPPLELTSPEPILSKPTNSRPESPRICLPNMSDPLECQEPLEAVPMPTISIPLPPLELTSLEPNLSKPTSSRPEVSWICLPNMSDPLEPQEPLEAVPMPTISMPPLELTSLEPNLSKTTGSRLEGSSI
ncbi:proline-rich protein 36-like [Pygocentrus nattereri]|uniref:proline-rich protein 36-like n=1 Tax=Pygocentrus nattereri TaxID=42514 RepID=UPI001890D19E|nr:proline-rich protein 36-like [Pygocentrus nattereri]